MRRWWRISLIACLIGTAGLAGSGNPPGTPVPIIGEEPAVKRHIHQADIEAGLVSRDELMAHGRNLFMASFNSLDGAGRPELTGKGSPRPRREMPDNFNRISAPDANACMGCHNLPAVGGGGDNVANVFQAEFNPLLERAITTPS